METPKVRPECLALMVLRRMRGVKSDTLATALGLTNKSMLRYESASLLPADRLELILEMLGFDREAYLELVAVLHRIRNRRPLADPAPATPVDPTPEERREIRALAAQAGREAEQWAEDLLEETSCERKTAAARAEARMLCGRLEKEPKPWLVVEKAREVQTWAVAEALAHRSADAATDRADRALELAALSCRVAELAPCTGPFRHRLLGYTLTFRENALRAAHRLSEAEALSEVAEAHWQAGAAAPGPLAEWRRLSLEGSLLRDLHRFSESLAHLDASLAIAPDSARGSLLVTKALTLEQMGDSDQALAVLTEAERIVTPRTDPRLAFIVRFNLGAFLCRLRHFAAAELVLRQIEATPGASIPLEKLWQSWLRASVAGGLGRWEAADKAYRAALRGFTRRGAARESALISLELAVLLCRRRRSRDLREIARGLDWVLEEKKLSRDAHAAVRHFCDTAEAGGMTTELAEQALQLLLRAPKADAPGLVSAEGPREEGPAATDLATFTPAGASGRDSSLPLVEPGSDHAVASAVGIDDAAAVPALAPRGWGDQEIAGRAPEAGHPRDEMIDEAGALHGSRPPREGR